MVRNKLLMSLCLLALLCGYSGCNKSSYNEIEVFPEASTYANPILDFSMPDPSILKDKDGYFYLYATEDIRNLPIYKSKDLVHWDFVNTAFTDQSRPIFEPNGGLWAPDINYINGQYVLYYSMSVWGGEETCGIGIAVSDNPGGPFEDLGKLFRSNEIGVTNSIDPFYIEDNNKKYLFWGSFRGIYGIELSDDGLSIKEGAQKKQIAGTAFEATCIHKKEGYYYFFGSIGSCCEGINSTYQLIVGRSEYLFGPYFNSKGIDMMNNGYDIVIGPNKSFVGNGHSSEIIQDDAGKDWIFYHGVDIKHPEGRVLLLDQVTWEKGWPKINDGTPSLKSNVPFFK